MNIAPRSRNTVKGNSRGKRGLGFLPPSLHPLGIAIGVGCGLLFSGGFNRCLTSNEVDLEPKITIRGSHANGNDKNFVTKDTSEKLNLSKVGFEGGAWTSPLDTVGRSEEADASGIHTADGGNVTRYSTTTRNQTLQKEPSLEDLLNSFNDTSWILNEKHNQNIPADQHLNVASKSEDQNDIQNDIVIPRMIYKVMLNSTDGRRADLESQSKRQHEALTSWTTRNPGYNMTLFGMDDCRAYLREYFHPVFLRTFNCISAHAGKTNLFRAAVVYREGGWYSDWMEEVHVDGLLDTLGSNGMTMVFPWAWSKKHEDENGSIMNAFFGAQPRHPMLAETLKILVLNVQQKYYGKHPQDNTGQGVMGRAFKKYYKDKESAKMSALPINTGRYHNRRDDYLFPKFSKKAGIITHYCEGCRGTEKEAWTSKSGNNNYRMLHKKKQYYCARANELLDFSSDKKW